MEIVPSTPARRRFVRYTPESELVLTARDLAVLCDLHDRRFMNARQLQTLYGANVPERLRFLFRHGYVDRPKAQRVFRLREGGGSHPLIYALANRGARAIAARGLRDAARRDWSELNLGLSEFSTRIPHELAVADVYVAFRRACASRSLDLVQGGELARGRDARALDAPGEGKPLFPDWVFAAVRGGAEPSLFFVEADRGTMPNARYSSPHIEHLAGKYERYLTYARGKRSLEQFGIANFRVLTVTDGGAAKVENVARAAHEVCGGVGAGRFLATSFAELEARDAFDVAWLDANGKEVRLVHDGCGQNW
jgi:hypothetical protein